jgi:hypothetical protein
MLSLDKIKKGISDISGTGGIGSIRDSVNAGVDNIRDSVSAGVGNMRDSVRAGIGNIRDSVRAGVGSVRSGVGSVRVVVVYLTRHLYFHNQQQNRLVDQAKCHYMLKI